MRVLLAAASAALAAVGAAGGESGERVSSMAASSLSELAPRLGADPSDDPIWSFSQDAALELVAYASAVTCAERALLEDWRCQVCVNGSFPVPAPPPLRNVTVLVSADGINQGLVGVDAVNARVVVSFRGSVDWRQYLFDLDAVPSREYAEMGCDSGCRVHKGFFDAFTELRAATLAAVRARLLPGKRVVFTGHSLGAAMATHAALAVLAAEPGAHVSGITFGQPRVGNPAFARWATARLQGWARVVNYLDPVPQIVKLPGVYEHMATEVWYYDKPRPGQQPLGRYKVCSWEDGEDSSCQNSRCGGFKLCLDGSFHTTYMNFVGITDVSRIC